MLHAFRLAKIVRHFYQFAALWLHFDFLTTYMFPNRFTKMLILFYWFYVLSLTKTCYKFEISSFSKFLLYSVRCLSIGIEPTLKFDGEKKL